MFDPLQPDPATAAAPHRVFNIGNSQPTELLRFIEVMEQALGREAIKDFQPMQPGDVVATAADTKALEQWVGFRPHARQIETGVACEQRSVVSRVLRASEIRAQKNRPCSGPADREP